MPLVEAAGIVLPCCLVAGLFLLKAIFLQVAAVPMGSPLTQISLPASCTAAGTTGTGTGGTVVGSWGGPELNEPGAAGSAQELGSEKGRV